MDVRRDTGDTHIVDVIQPHIEVLGDIVVLATWNKAEFILSVIECHGVRIELIVLFTDKIQLSADLEMFEGFATFPVAETGDVEVGQMDFLDGLVLFRLLCTVLW